jgi:hypothetical protein
MDLEHLKNCEAKEWLNRYAQKVSTIGSRKAHAWWQGVLGDLQRIRGESATLDLRQRMNRIKNETLHRD